MLKSFKEFWRSYWELCKECSRWQKKHWKGVIVFNIVAIATIVIPWMIAEKLEEKRLHDKIKKDMEEG